MNIDKLKLAEKTFLHVYPKGFESEEIKAIGKKHRIDKVHSFAQERFSPDAFENPKNITEDMIRLVSMSSMVSIYEKPRFRDSVRSMDYDEKAFLVDGLFNLLHGDEALGFHQILDMLSKYNIAKWTLITVFRCYYYPKTDLLYKPTTVKNVIKFFELEGLEYKPRPYYDFFVKYRKAIDEMKKHVDKSLFEGSSAAFSGFLMMSMNMLQNKH